METRHFIASQLQPTLFSQELSWRFWDGSFAATPRLLTNAAQADRFLFFCKTELEFSQAMGRTSDARVRLMDAAYDLIWESSYGAVTIDAICERAGVKKGSFYYFFESKSDLAVAAIETWWIERKATLNRFFQKDTPPLERIQKYIDYVAERQIQAYEKNGQVLGCPIFTLGSEICTQDERLRLLILEILAVGIGHFEDAIRDAQACGDVEGNNATLKARMLWASYEGSLTRARMENNAEIIRHLSSDVLELIGVRPALV
jgi:TetR/AcrR family transcriptional regulator, transcriptional repressor for nem operon